MYRSLRSGVVGLTTVLLAALAPAQGSLSVPAVLVAGTSVAIGYSNPAMAGKKITLQIESLTLPDPTTQSFEIELDAQGKGSVQWTVTSALAARFSAPDAQMLEQEITP